MSKHPPARLIAGDVVQVSIKQHYRRLTVIEARDESDTLQTVTASAPRLGSFRFTWHAGVHGKGHGMIFYFVRHEKSPG